MKKYPTVIVTDNAFWKLIDPKFGQYKAYLDPDFQTIDLTNFLPRYSDYRYLIGK